MVKQSSIPIISVCCPVLCDGREQILISVGFTILSEEKKDIYRTESNYLFFMFIVPDFFITI
jgi:hypothetical protein